MLVSFPTAGRTEADKLERIQNILGSIDHFPNIMAHNGLCHNITPQLARKSFLYFFKKLVHQNIVLQANLYCFHSCRH